jgi:hypothetical protein
VPTRRPTAPSLAEPRVFFFGPFRFESELDIPELHNSTGPGDRLVHLRLGEVPQSLPNATPAGNFVQLTPTEYLLNIPGTARYYVAHGNEVRVEIAPGAPIANVSTYLLGSVFGVLCHQNGLLPLHASAVDSGGSVVAFPGDSGAGKSTLAACLQRRGHRIVSDDICLLDPADDAMHVVPVAGWLKLWNQSLQYLGETPDEQHRVFSTDDKYRLFLPGTDSTLRRLHRVVFLSKDPDPRAQPALQPLSLPEAIAALMDTTYVSYVPALTGQQHRIFRQCARVFQQAQPWRLTVPWSLDRIDSVVDLLERDLFSPLDPRP